MYGCNIYEEIEIGQVIWISAFEYQVLQRDNTNFKMSIHYLEMVNPFLKKKKI